MVVFTCNHCGDSVKKASVVKHYNTKCNGNLINVSCMDCQKDFLGDAHVAHTKCITEAEKYSAKGFVPKTTQKNTNAKKQEGWTIIVHSILQNSAYKLNARTREAFQRLEQLENVPRKQMKFENFACKCLHFPKPVVNEVWTILEKELKKMEEARKIEIEEKNKINDAKKRERTENGEEAETEPPSKKKKNKKLNSVENGNSIEIEEPAKKKKNKNLNCVENGNSNEIEEPAKNKKNKKLNSVENGNSKEIEEPAKNKKNKKLNGLEENGHTTETEQPAKKKKKQKMNGDQNKEVAATVENKKNNIIESVKVVDQAETDVEDFKWQEILAKITSKQGDAGITLEKLQSKVLKKYQAKLGLEELTEKQQKKFSKKFGKKLKNCTNIVVVNYVAKIV